MLIIFVWTLQNNSRLFSREYNNSLRDWDVGSASWVTGWYVGQPFHPPVHLSFMWVLGLLTHPLLQHEGFSHWAICLPTGIVPWREFSSKPVWSWCFPCWTITASVSFLTYPSAHIFTVSLFNGAHLYVVYECFLLDFVINYFFYYY